MRPTSCCLLLITFCVAAPAVTAQTNNPLRIDGAPDQGSLLAAIQQGEQAVRGALKQGDVRAAIEATQRVLVIQRELYGESHEQIAKTNDLLAQLHTNVQDWNAAVEFRNTVLAVLKALHPKNHWRRTDARLALARAKRLAQLTRGQRAQLHGADALAQRGVEQFNQGDPITAMATFEKAAEMLRDLLGENDSLSLMVLDNRAKAEKMAGKLQAAETSLRQLVTKQRTVLGEHHPKLAAALDLLASVYEAQEKFDEAIVARRMALTVIATVADVRQWQIADAKLAIKHTSRLAELTVEQRSALKMAKLNAKLAVRQGENERAMARLMDSARVQQEILGAKSPRLAITLSNLASVCGELRRYQVAEGLHRRAIEIRTEVLTPSHPDLATSMNNLGTMLQSQAKYAEAEVLLRKTVEFRRASLGENHKDYATAVNNLASVLTRLERFDEAETLHRKALTLRRETLGDNHLDTAASLNNLGALLRDRGHYEKAAELLEQSLAIKQNLGSGTLRTTLHELGLTYQRLDRLDEAERLHFAAMMISKGPSGTRPFDFTTDVRNLGAIHYRRGNYTQVRWAYTTVLSTLKSTVGTEHPEYATTLDNYVAVLIEMGDIPQASSFAQEALQVRSKALGPSHPKVAMSLVNLAKVHRIARQPQQAATLYEQAVKILAETPGEDHPDYASAISNLGSLYRDQGKYKQAEPLLRQALRIRREKLGDAHPSVANSLASLARLHRDRGNFEQGEKHYREAIEIRRLALGERHPDTVFTYNSLALLYAAAGRWDDAVTTMDLARKQLHDFSRRILPALSEKEQLQFLMTQDADSLHAALSLGLKGQYDIAAKNASAEWVLNAKAVAVETLGQRAVLLRQASEPKTAKIASKLLRVRRQIAVLAMGNDEKLSPDQRRQEISRLEEQQARLVNELGKITQRGQEDRSWVSVKQIRTALPVDAVLIEVARVRQWNFAATGAESPLLGDRYAAWVIPPANQGEIRLVDLGGAKSIDRAVRDYRETMDAVWSNVDDFPEAHSEKDLRQRLSSVTQRILQPLIKATAGQRRWIVSPDDSLWLLPWAAIPMSDGRYAIEQFEISYVVTGRDLVRRAPVTRTSSPLLVANPDYGLTSSLSEGRLSEPGRASYQASIRSPRSSAMGTTTWDPLPGTADELTAIEQILRESGEEVEIHLGAEALENVIKTARAPRVLLMATHGYFLDNQSRPASTGIDQTNRLNVKPLAVLENPLLRCGLVLAGANRPKVAITRSLEDGLLTGLEIAGCDFQGTEIVVLSACNTALGRLQNSEGVAGLRQAFQLAGAQTVVATLWQIPDKQTCQLTSSYFRHLAAGSSRSSSLRRAQLEVIAARRKQFGTAHPLFWAAFTTTGDLGEGYSDDFVAQTPAPVRANPSDKITADLSGYMEEFSSSPEDAVSGMNWLVVAAVIGFILLGVSGVTVYRRLRRT